MGGQCSKDEFRKIETIPRSALPWQRAMDAAEQLDAERVSKEKLNGWWFFKDLLGLFITIWGR